MIIGVTGGIGSGKTTVTDIFAELGIDVIDADLISRQITAAKGCAIPKIASSFGVCAVNSDGSMNRKFIRDLVFSDPDKRLLLESILHPIIKEEVLRQVKLSHSPYRIVSVPLLKADSFWTQISDRILLVDCPEFLQIERVKNRDSLLIEQIQSIIKAQPSRKERLSFADDILENTSTTEDLRRKIIQLDCLYRRLSKELEQVR